MPDKDIHIVNCDVNPFVPEGGVGSTFTDWAVKEHIRGGQLELDISRIQLYLSQQQGGSRFCINGHRLRKELKNKSVLNANVLDFLYANLRLIPEEWKGKNIFFWGTIYRNTDDYLHERLYVRCLKWFDDGWDQSHIRIVDCDEHWPYLRIRERQWRPYYTQLLDNDWFSVDPAAILVR